MVNFNGHTILISTGMDGYFAPDFGYACGSVGYSFNCSVQTDAAILQVVINNSSGKPSGLSILRLEHNLGAINNGLSLFLQNPFTGLDAISDPTNYFSLLTAVDREDLALFYDGEWHDVFITWDLRKLPPEVIIKIDHAQMATTPTRWSGNTGKLKFAGTSTLFRNSSLSWVVGADVIDTSAPYQGQLNKLTLFASPTTLEPPTTRTRVECYSYMIASPSGSIEHGPITVEMVPAGCFPFEDTPDPINRSLTNPTKAQLSLGGSAAEFSTNYGAGSGKIANPFNLSTSFRVNGHLTDAPTNANKGAVDLSLGANLSNTNSNTPAPALATQPSPGQLSPGVYAQPIAPNGLTAPPAPLGGTTVPNPLGLENRPDISLNRGHTEFPVNNPTATFSPVTETPTETFTVHGDPLTTTKNGPPKWDAPRAITIVRKPVWAGPDGSIDNMNSNKILIQNRTGVPIPLSTPIAPAGLISFWYRTKVPALPIPSLGWYETEASLFAAFRAGNEDVGIFSCGLPFTGPTSTKQIFTPYQQFSLTFTKGTSKADRNVQYFIRTDASHPLPADTDWHHVIAGWNLGGSSGNDHPLPSQVHAQNSSDVRFWCAVDGVQVPMLSIADSAGKETTESFSLPWGEVNSYELGMNRQHGTPYIGDLAEFYLWVGSQYIDFGTQIISSFMKNRTAVELLNDGSGPLGVKPLIYLSGDTKSFFNNPGPTGPLTFCIDTDPAAFAAFDQKYGARSTDVVKTAFDDPFFPPPFSGPGGQPSLFPSTMFSGKSHIEIIFRGIQNLPF